MPCVPPGMKQPRRLACSRIDSGEIRTLVPIAEKTGKCKIARYTLFTMNSGDNVIDLTCKTVVCLRHLAVFASHLRTLPNECSQCSMHECQETRRRDLSIFRARDWRMESIEPTRP